VYNLALLAAEGEMLSRIMKHVRDLPAWAAYPATLLDRFLDHLDRLNRFVLPAAAGDPSCRYVEVEARRRQFRD
jgi:hypothetical protein